MEYRHGPISITGPGRAVWVFGAAPDGLAEDVAATGGTLGRRPTSTRWPTWSAPSGSRSPSPHAAASTPTGRAT